MSRCFLRARKPEEKEQRRAHLLTTARELLERGAGARTLSLNELARQAGMAKANVYRYFESREALLLELLWDEWLRWFGELSRELAGCPQLGLEALIRRLTRSLSGEALLCELASELPSALEQNLSEEAVRTFKQSTLALFRDTASFLHERCPVLAATTYTELLHDIAQAVIGLYRAAHPAPAVARVLEEPELAFFRRDFRSELERFALALAAQHEKHEALRVPARGSE